MQRTSRAAALYLLLTFAAGVAVGAFALRLYTSHGVSANSPPSRSEQYRRMYLQEMESRLKLTADQREKLVSILDATRKLFNELNEKHRPEYQAIHQHQVEQIRALLDEQQNAEYTKLQEEREARRKAKQY